MKPKPIEKKWAPPETPKNVLIADWWDRSPCYWICDLTKLDESNVVQAQYKKAVLDAVAAMRTFNNDGQEWLLEGKASVPDGAEWTNGRPSEEVEHARVLPPCTIDAYVVMYYPE